MRFAIRTAAAVAIIGFLLTAAAGVFWITEGNDRVLDSIASRVETRTGGETSIADLQVRPGSLHLENVKWAFPEDGLTVAIGGVVGRFSIDEIITDRHRAFREIAVRDVHLTLDLRNPTTLDKLRRWNRSPFDGCAGEEPDGEPDPGPSPLAQLQSVRVESFRIDVIDSTGTRPIVRDFSGGLTRDPSSHWTVRGHGKLGQSGTFRCDLASQGSDGCPTGSVEFQDLSLLLLTPFLPSVPLTAPEQTRVDGTLDLTAENTDCIRFSSSFSARPLHLQSPIIAEAALEDIHVRAELSGTIHPQSSRIQIDPSEFTVNDARVAVHADLASHGDHVEFEAEVQVPKQEADDLIRAAPAALLGQVRDIRCRGPIEAFLKVRFDSQRPEDTVFDIDVKSEARILRAPRELGVTRLRRPFDHRAYDGEGRPIELRLGPGTESWTPLAEVSPLLVRSVLAHEDAQFHNHKGFAPWAIEAAVRRNLKERRFAYGASTITMQLSRNLFLGRDKRLNRKAQEVLCTWWLEQELSKEEILELYLNVIEYGPSIYGIGAASEYYFGRSPSELTLAQSVFLANLLPSPVRYHRQFERDRLWPSYAERMRFLIRHMNAKGTVDDEAKEEALADIADFSFREPAQKKTEPRLHDLSVQQDSWF